jgi:arsenical pump membrane protein
VTQVIQAVAYSTLALTVTLAVSRPRLGLRLRFSPGSAALLGVLVLFCTHLLSVADLITAARIQWRPLLSLGCIMVMTGVVQEVGAFDRLALRVESYARTTSITRTFTLVFLVSVITPSLLNNDSAILLLTPLVVALTRRLYPNRPGVTEAFAFAVFLAPGVAPLVVSNPMNMIVAEYAGIGFNGYAAVMLPISIGGAVVTYGVLRLCFARTLSTTATTPRDVVVPPAHPAEKPTLALLILVFAAYPIAAACGGQIWMVTPAGALASLALAARYRVAPLPKLLGHVSPDILLFLWGVFLVVVGLRHVGVIDRLATLYRAVPDGSGLQIGVIGVSSAVGSAIVDNHPMSILNMLALGAHGDSRQLLAALVGGDIGPRLLPVGSLAGLLWTDLLRRSDVHISVGRFVKLGTIVLVPTLALSLLLLAHSGR